MSSTHSVSSAAEVSKPALGFWIYLMTDCVLFASLFATYAVLRGGTAGGVSGADIFELDFIFIETVLLLLSSLTSGVAVVAARFRRSRLLVAMMAATFALGAGFLLMELYEFGKLAGEGHGWWTSAFLSAYFTLVGTHGLHIAIGLLWLAVLGVALWRKGITEVFNKRLTLFSLFWHFLDIIWIFIFTLVYLIGATS